MAAEEARGAAAAAAEPKRYKTQAEVAAFLADWKARISGKKGLSDLENFFEQCSEQDGKLLLEHVTKVNKTHEEFNTYWFGKRTHVLGSSLYTDIRKWLGVGQKEAVIAQGVYAGSVISRPSLASEKSVSRFLRPCDSGFWAAPEFVDFVANVLRGPPTLELKAYFLEAARCINDALDLEPVIQATGPFGYIRTVSPPEQLRSSLVAPILQHYLNNVPPSWPSPQQAPPATPTVTTAFGLAKKSAGIEPAGLVRNLPNAPRSFWLHQASAPGDAETAADMVCLMSMAGIFAPVIVGEMGAGELTHKKPQLDSYVNNYLTTFRPRDNPTLIGFLIATDRPVVECYGYYLSATNLKHFHCVQLFSGTTVKELSHFLFALHQFSEALWHSGFANPRSKLPRPFPLPDFVPESLRGHALVGRLDGQKRVFKLIDNRFHLGWTGRHANVELYPKMGTIVHFEHKASPDSQPDVCLFSYLFIEGTTVANSGDHFLSAATSLCELNRKSIAHGDIRGSNIVFSSAAGIPQATLIDFDFAGRHKLSIYPANLNRGEEGDGDIGDAMRHPAAVGGAPVSIFHDWYSLLSIIRLYRPGPDDAAEFDAMLRAAEDFLVDADPTIRTADRLTMDSVPDGFFDRMMQLLGRLRGMSLAPLEGLRHQNATGSPERK